MIRFRKVSKRDMSQTLSQERKGGADNILPVVQIPVSLRDLRAEVDGVTSEEEVVLRGDGESVAGESSRVDDQGTCHCSGDAGEKNSKLVTDDIICITCHIPSGFRLHMQDTGMHAELKSKEGRRESAYISGSFCVSITAAMGIPKLETGPQKSVP